MSGICDTCQRNQDCRRPIDGMDSCRLYISCKESNYSRLFGTPERAARTLGTYFIEGCDGVKCGDCPFHSEGDYMDCRIMERNDDALLEWLRGES